MKLFSFLYRAKIDPDPEMHFKHIKYSNDDEYQGELLNDLRHGHGTYKFQNGNRYVGEWKEHAKHGQGKYYYYNGELYIGQWSDNKKNGQGTHFYLNGDRYVGSWVQNKKDGKGIIYYGDQSIYTGCFKQNKRSGVGYFYNPREKKFYQQLYDDDLVQESVEIAQPSREFQDIFRVNSQHLKHPHFLEKEDPQHELPNNESPTQQQDSDKKDQIKSGSAPCESDHQKKSNDEQNSSHQGSQMGYETMQMIENMDQIEKQKKMQEWGIQEVCTWLDQLNLSQYRTAFTENQMSGRTLYDLTDKELKEDLGITVLGHRKTLLQQIELNKKYHLKMMLKSVKKRKASPLETGTDQKGATMSMVFNSIDQQRYVRLFSYMEKIEKIDEEEDMQQHQDSSDEKKKKRKEISSNSSESEKKKSSEDLGDSVKLKKQKSRRKKQRKQTLEATKSGESADEESSLQKHNSQTYSPQKIKQQEYQGSQGGMEEVRPTDQLDDSPSQDNFHLEGSLSKQGASLSPKGTDSSFKMIQIDGQITDFMNIQIPPLERKISTQVHQTVKPPTLDKKMNSDPLNKDEDSSSQESDISSNSSSSSSSDDDQVKCAKLKNKVKKDLNAQKQQCSRIKAFNMSKFLNMLQEFGINERVLIKYQELTFGPIIGEGGYGVVFKGKWLGQDVAIKSYGKRKTSGKLRYRLQMADFLKEVEVISNLRHPNIVLYMGVCYKKFNYYLITEYLEQGSLFDHLHKKKNQVDQKSLMQIVEDIALGMNYLHGRKVLHCDLKSSNVLIDQNWNVKLCDFGLSRIKKKIDNKKSNRRIGTPHWMAPEIMRGEPYKEEADVYSFGMILWEIITSKIPYEGLSQTQIIGSVGYGNDQIEIPKISNPPILAQLAQMCLNKDQNKRPDFNQIVKMIQKGQKSEAQIKKQAIQQLVDFFD